MKINSIWACEENALKEFLEVSAMMHQDFTDEQAKAFFDLEESNQKIEIEVEGDTASFEINGILTKNGLPPFFAFFGIEGTAYTEISKALSRLSEDESIKKVNLIFDTPGGDVNGLDEVSQEIKTLGKKKDVWAFNAGLMASAGYYLASQTNKIVATSPSAESGSIGVVISQVDRSSSKVVNVISKNAPLKRANVSTEKGLAELQRRVDALERVFVSRVAKGRGVSEDQVLKNFGRGGLLIAKDPDEKMTDGMSVGMIDKVQGVEDGNSSSNTSDSLGGDNVVTFTRENQKEERREEEKEPRDQIDNSCTAAGEPITDCEESHNQQKEQEEMDLEKLKAENPGLAAEIKRIKTEAYDSGYRAKTKEFELVTPVLNSDAYPESVKDLAAKALTGEVSMDMFKGAVVTFDALNAKGAEESAIEQTEEAGETPGQQVPVASQDGVIRSDDDLAFVIDDIKNIRA